MAFCKNLYSSLITSSPESGTQPPYSSNRIRKSSKCVEDTLHAYTTESSSFWRPIYLTKGALAAFFVTFSALSASIQIMLLLSNRNTGLSGVNDGPHRVLWTYGPTALLTLVASFWARVECQSKIIAPWTKMKQGFTTARKSLFLDYLSQFQLLSIVSAVRNKDHTVAAATFTSILIKVLLVLSTSLCVLSRTEVVHSNVPLTLRSDFVNDPSGLTANGSLAFASFASMMRFGTSLPTGTSERYAYQLIESEFLDTPSTIFTTLEGFNGDLECEPAALPASDVLLNVSYITRFPIRSTSCTFNVSLDAFFGIQGNLVRFIPGGCGGSSNIDDQRLAIIIAVTVDRYDNMTISISTSNSFICKPTYQIHRLDFTARGSYRFVSKSRTVDSRVLSNVHPWSIMQSHLDAVPNLPFTSGTTASILDQTVAFDQYGFLAYLLANSSGNPPAFSDIFEDQEGAKTLFSNYYQQYSALLAHTSLMKPVSRPLEGTVTETGDRFKGKRDADVIYKKS